MSRAGCAQWPGSWSRVRGTTEACHLELPLATAVWSITAVARAVTTAAPVSASVVIALATSSAWAASRARNAAAQTCVATEHASVQNVASRACPARTIATVVRGSCATTTFVFRRPAWNREAIVGCVVAVSDYVVNSGAVCPAAGSRQPPALARGNAVTTTPASMENARSSTARGPKKRVGFQPTVS